MSVVLVGDEEDLAIIILLDEVDFQIQPRDGHSENSMLVREAVALHLEFLVIFLRDCDAVL